MPFRHPLKLWCPGVKLEDYLGSEEPARPDPSELCFTLGVGPLEAERCEYEWLWSEAVCALMRGDLRPLILADPVPSSHSGLTREAHSKEVEQVYLRCSAGSVEWMYPTGALIVNLRPNTVSAAHNLTVCIKPFRDSSGANIYLEKTGELRLLVRDVSGEPGQVRCVSLEQGGLFVEATPQQDISRRTTGFQYELLSGQRGLGLHALSGEYPVRGWCGLANLSCCFLSGNAGGSPNLTSFFTLS